MGGISVGVAGPLEAGDARTGRPKGVWRFPSRLGEAGNG
jgi:hypothetical protein